MEEFAGAGDGPTVVLVSGSLMPALLWAPVQQQLAQFARVVSYDRAGCGFSEPAGRDRSGERVVEELDTLLEEWRGQMGTGHRRVDALSRRLLVLLSLFGLPRRSMQGNPGLLTGDEGAWIDQFTPAERAGLGGTLYTPKQTLAALREWVSIGDLEEAVRQAGRLGDLPLVVLSRTRPHLDDWGYSAETKARIWALT